MLSNRVTVTPSLPCMHTQTHTHPLKHSPDTRLGTRERLATSSESPSFSHSEAAHFNKQQLGLSHQTLQTFIPRGPVFLYHMIFFYLFTLSDTFLILFLQPFSILFGRFLCVCVYMCVRLFLCLRPLELVTVLTAWEQAACVLCGTVMYSRVWLSRDRLLFCCDRFCDETYKRLWTFTHTC